MTLDVIVPTYNRSALLRLAVRSLLDTPAPDELDVTIYVVDNNSSDDTRAVVAELATGSPRPVRYVHAPVQGSSHSRNAGIAAGTGQVLAFIDDDEQITSGWYNAVVREFADPTLDFLSGPYLADPSVTLPPWIPPGYHGVIGVLPVRPRQPMNDAFPGNLMGGNGAMRRSLFDLVGTYDPALGRTGTGLLSEEDADLYRRILRAGLRGIYAPDFSILHHIPTARLTRRYFRRWCFWRGISLAHADRLRPEPVPRLFGVPRYRVREALAGALELVGSFGRERGGEAFARELPLWTLLGFLRGHAQAPTGAVRQKL